MSDPSVGLGLKGISDGSKIGGIASVSLELPFPKLGQYDAQGYIAPAVELELGVYNGIVAKGKSGIKVGGYWENNNTKLLVSVPVYGTVGKNGNGKDAAMAMEIGAEVAVSFDTGSGTQVLFYTSCSVSSDFSGTDNVQFQPAAGVKLLFQ